MAIRLGHRAAVNPVEQVRLPNAPESEETYAYSMDEMDSFLRLVTEPVARTIVAVAAYASLRRSEIASLTWEAYDGKKLQVLQSVSHGKIGQTRRLLPERGVQAAVALRM